jgi:hypothetical protein
LEVSGGTLTTRNINIGTTGNAGQANLKMDGGTINADVLTIGGIYGRFADGTAQAGFNGGTLNVSNLVHNRGTLFTLGDGAGTAATLNLLGGETNRVASGMLVNSDGTLNLTNNGTLIASAASTNAGTVNIGSGSAAAFGNGLSTSGSLIVDGTLTGATTIASGGVLSGSGTIASATIDGLHSPGHTIGIQTFGGGLTYRRGATVVWELGANATGARGTGHDGVDVGGPLVFAGATKLRLRFVGPVDWDDDFWRGQYLGRDGWLVYQAGAQVTGLENLTIDFDLLLDGQDRPLDLERGEFSLYHDAASHAVYLNFARPAARGSMIGIR